MGLIHLHLPAELVKAASLDQGNVSEETAKLIALQLFREDKVSLGRAAELCGTPLEEFLAFASDRQVPLHYGFAEVEEDRLAFQRLQPALPAFKRLIGLKY